MKLLLTAFEPFGGQSLNPALEASRLVPDHILGCEIIKLEVPTVFGRSLQVLGQAMAQHEPDFVLCLGQAGGRETLSPERVAINVDDALAPDNAGNRPLDRPVRPGGPAAYFSNLPVKAMVREMQGAGLPASLSNSAGTFVCNHLFYGLMDLIATQYPKARGGFMHVPYLPFQVEALGKDLPSLPLSDIVLGISLAITAILNHRQDLALPLGSEH